QRRRIDPGNPDREHELLAYRQRLGERWADLSRIREDQRQHRHVDDAYGRRWRTGLVVATSGNDDYVARYVDTDVEWVRSLVAKCDRSELHWRGVDWPRVLNPIGFVRRPRDIAPGCLARR